MKAKDSVSESRRLMARFFAMSPLFALPELSLGEWSLENQDPVITKATQALNVYDFKRVAREKLSTAHYGYLETGVLDDRTLLENEEAFRRIKLRMRRLIDTEQADTSTTIWGENWASPIMLCPCGSQKAFHAEGELATAKAAGSQNLLQILSTMSTVSIEAVIRANGSGVWFQLYPSKNWANTASMVARAEAAGSKAIVLTVDTDYQDKRETYLRAMRADQSNCQSCHGKRTRANFLRNKPMIRGLEPSYQGHNHLTWSFVDRLRALTNLKIVLKGIVSKEDGEMALDRGIDGIIVSNHGGRVSESGSASLDSLSEVAEGIDGQIPIMMDGGVRRGKDVFKAIACGASLVGIGRPYLWGLSAFGQEGVEMVLKLLQAELKVAMQQTGVRSISEISRAQLL